LAKASRSIQADLPPEDPALAIKITIEAEHPASRATVFRVSINGATVAEGLRASEAQEVVGKSLQRIALPRKRKAA
jgi:hypothetical protein